VGELIELVLTPGEQNDALLAQRFGNDAPDYASLIQKVRDLVAD